MVQLLPGRPRRPLSAVLAAIAAMASSVALPVTASEIQDAYHAHFKQCLRLFFNDKPAHDVECLPNTMPDIPANSGSGGGSVQTRDGKPIVVPVVTPPVVTPPVVTPPPPPPVVTPDPEVDSSYPDVDSSYPQA